MADIDHFKLSCPWNISESCEDVNGSTYSDNHDSRARQIKIVYTTLTGIMSLLSLTGCATIIHFYRKIPELQTTSRKLLIYLSCCDIGIAVGNLAGMAWMAVLNDKLTDFTYNSTISSNWTCTTQAAISSSFSIASFLWTSFIAVNLFLTVVYQNKVLLERLVWLPHAVCWGTPFITMIVTLSNHRYGYNTCAQYEWWCWVASNVDTETHGNPRTLLIVWQLITGKFWEILSYVVVVVMYGGVKMSIRNHMKNMRQGHRSDGERSPFSSTDATLSNANRKLIFVPLVFIIARIWGTLRFFVELSNNTDCCTCLFVLAVMQGVGDSSQGFLNCTVFIFTSPQIRSRLSSNIRHFFHRTSVPDHSCAQDVSGSNETSTGKRLTDYGSTRNVNSVVEQNLSAQPVSGSSVTYQQ